MISLDVVRRNPELVKNSLTKRNESVDVVDKLLEIDAKYREQTRKLEVLQAEKNILDKTASADRKRQSQLKEELKLLQEKSSKKYEEELLPLLADLPNIVLDDVPAGKSEADNVVVAEVGEIDRRSGKSHEELMQAVDGLDLDTASDYSGSRFRYLKGDIAKAHLKMINLAVEFAIENGFTFVIPPVMTRSKTLRAGGFFPRGEEEAYKVGDDSYLVGTSEPMLLALAAGKKLKKGDLPLRFVGFSTCFRQEAGSYGKDVKGMFRTHQFDKVEMVSITSPDKSAEEHEFLVSMQEKFVSKFAIPYRKMLLCAADQSQIAAKQYDIESWYPSQQKYRETHSCSNCSDYQSRQLKIKVDSEDGTSVLAHTLNGTLMTERLLLAIIENNQTSEGDLTLPKVLR